MDNKACKEKLEKLSMLVMETGEALLECGGEIYRVDETIAIMAKAYGANARVYTLSNGLFFTLTCGEAMSTYVMEVPIAEMNLGRVAQINNLSRAIQKGEYTIEQAHAKLKEIKQEKAFDKKTRIFFAGVAGATFSYLFGGRTYDLLAAYIASSLLYIFALFASSKKFPKYLRIVVGSSLATFISQALFYLGLGNNLNYIIIGAIITMVPGATLTIAVREYIYEDYLSGTIHLVDALLTSISMAVGVITMFEITRMLF
ncbi:MAG: threonine/serine exporter family protein [Clostridiales bacterium]|nr:threonine/serine exporter family protein [Clostridiales bacterium]